MPVITISKATQVPKEQVFRNAFNTEGFIFEWIDRAHPDRKGLEEFIAQVFYRQYNAKLTHFMEVLIGCRTKEDGWIAGLGFSPLVGRQAFLEQYLDQPVERLIDQATQGLDAVKCSRWDIVEFGNFASVWPGASRAMIMRLTEWLFMHRIRWVVFTATNKLKNSFSRLNYNPVQIACADPQRLRGSIQDWGTYYDADPQVMFGDVNAAHARFSNTY